MSVLGAEIKFNVHVEPIGDVWLSDCDFKCTFFVYNNKTVVVPKEEMIMIDDDNYLAIVDSNRLGTGRVKCKIEMEVPDADCEDGFRKEVEVVCTDEVIRPAVALKCE